jgi:tripeptide aminopeptidase
MQTLLDEFLRLVAIDSPSWEEDQIALYVEQHLFRLGLATEYDDAGNLWGTLPGEGGHLLFNAHLDTVPLAVGARPVVEGGVVRTDGTTALGADDKAAIAAILWALEKIKERELSHPTLTILFTRAEEVGLAGAAQLDRSKLVGIEYGYTLDVTGPIGQAVGQAAYHDGLEAVFYGRAAHAGFEPEKGISAIMMASDAIATMPLLRIDEETTANIGSFVAEGSKNIVSNYAKLVGEARSLSPKKLAEQSKAMKNALQEAAKRGGGEVLITQTRLYDGYLHAPNTTALNRFRTACAALDIPFRMITTLGGSDANILNAMGVPAVACSSGYSGAHSTDEQIEIKDLEALASLTLELMTL